TGLLGYGPSIADPMTGEIVNARTVMYIGTMKKYLKNSYDELVHEKLNALAAEAGKKGTGEGIVAANATPAQLKFSEGLIQSFIKKAGADAVSVPGHVGKKPSFKMLAAEYSKAAQLLKVSGAHRHGSDKYGQHSHGLREVTRAQSDLKGQLDAFLTANCMYDAELFNFTGAIEDEVEKVIAEVGLKPWIALNAEEQEKVINALMPFVWIPTFVHELGHNLGLRHNFGASEDKANFYTDEERKDMGIKRKFAYSSVMDYPYKSTNELQIMGKYDIAALQFGYAEKVELKDGNVIGLEQYRAEKPELKPYDFCTDEHVGINPNCNRFDEGTSLTEIALHHAQAYEESYAKRNFRNNKLNFSLYQDGSYMGSVGSHFDSIRATFERYEKIKRAYGIPDGHEIWKTNEFLKDLRGAVEVSAAFLKKVITTSDLLCAVVKKSDPTTISGLKSLKSMSPNGAATCFDTANVFPDEDEVIVAQGGKLFQSAKDPRNGNPYLDQIDVRGIWIDKLLAVDTLVARKTGIRSFAELNDNMLDIADLSGPIRETLESVLNDEVVSDITLVTSNGQVIEGQIPVQFYSAADAQNGHLIEEPLSEGLAKHLGINGSVPFNEYLISALKTHLPSKSTMNDPSSLLNSMKVLTTVPTDGRPIGDFETVTIGGDGFLAHKTSPLAVAMISKFKATSTLESAIAGV
ncbi:MAG: zinc-dependent metalloprotease, partial [Bdellovibrionota bacterium]